ncbi:MAG: Peptidase [Nitrospira sp.]|nr:Peptidase [Nitrospira sp.]
MPSFSKSSRGRASALRSLPDSSPSNVSSRQTSILRHLKSLVGERHPHSAPEALVRAAAYLRAQLAGFQWTTTRQSFRALGKSYVNILAIKAPAGRAAKGRQAPLLIGAHYDTVVASPGADDNASALAVLLDVADQLRYTVVTRPVWLAAFCLEEQGLLGSRAFTRHLKEIGQPLYGAIVLECVGYVSHESGSQGTPPGIPITVPTVGNFLGIVGNDASRDLIAAVERSARSAAPAMPTVALAVPGRGEALPDVRRSDHAAFWDEGYPAVMLTDTANFRNPHYHLPSDTLDTLDLGFIEAVSRTVAASIVELAGKAP